MLKVFQLMMAFSVGWLMMTELVPAPITVALPPTTVGPVGWAPAGATPSARSAVEAIRRVRRRGDILLVPQKRPVVMKKNRQSSRMPATALAADKSTVTPG